MDEERSHNLDAEISTINIVSQEQISSFSWVTADLKKLHQIIVLAVDITANCDWRIHFKQVGLGPEKFGTFMNDPKSLLLGQSAFAIEMLLQELDIGFGAILRRPELVVRRYVEGWRLDIWEELSAPMRPKCARKAGSREE
jgi:hypothetical protein